MSDGCSFAGAHSSPVLNLRRQAASIGFRCQPLSAGSSRMILCPLLWLHHLSIPPQHRRHRLLPSGCFNISVSKWVLGLDQKSAELLLKPVYIYSQSGGNGQIMSKMLGKHECLQISVYSMAPYYSFFISNQFQTFIIVGLWSYVMSSHQEEM